MNSSWNAAFDIADHFELGEGVNVDFSYWGINNTGGEWINYSIINGTAQFKPAVGFIGFRGFILSAMGSGGTTESNYFTVTIVEDINYPPVFTGTIEDILLTRTRNVTIYLDQFFEDPDGTTLTYSAPAADNVSVVFDGNKMYVWLRPSFIDFEKFRVVANDGVNQIRSNSITIYLENNGSVRRGDLLEEVLNDSLFVSPRGLATQRDSINGSDSEEDEDSKGGFWIIVVSGVLSVVLIISGVIYFVFFDKGSVQADKGSVQAPVVNTAVNDYLKKINAMNDNRRY